MESSFEWTKYIFFFCFCFCLKKGGLFFYDIFWVFGTDVMVTVAKSFDAPIKLLFPKNIFAAEYSFSMLGKDFEILRECWLLPYRFPAKFQIFIKGLGDIVIPGMFIALLLRFDLHQNQKKNISSNSAPYFRTCFLFYIIGLATTIFVMHTFKAAQVCFYFFLESFCLVFFVWFLIATKKKNLNKYGFFWFPFFFYCFLFSFFNNIIFLSYWVFFFVNLLMLIISFYNFFSLLFCILFLLVLDLLWD